MIIKICGIKSLEIAQVAVEAGADMLGYNFYPLSSRYITPEKCAEIVAGLKDVRKPVFSVGVFANEDPLRVQEIMDACGLDLAQLSGDETLVDLAVLNGRGFKAVRPNSLSEASEHLKMFGRSQAPALLVF